MLLLHLLWRTQYSDSNGVSQSLVGKIIMYHIRKQYYTRMQSRLHLVNLIIKILKGDVATIRATNGATKNAQYR